VRHSAAGTVFNVLTHLVIAFAVGKVERAKAEKTVDFLKVMAGVIFTIFIFKEFMAHDMPFLNKLIIYKHYNA